MVLAGIPVEAALVCTDPLRYMVYQSIVERVEMIISDRMQNQANMIANAVQEAFGG